jgi:hypothetical protein
LASSAPSGGGGKIDLHEGISIVPYSRLWFFEGFYMTLQRDYDHYMLIHFLFYFLSAFKEDLATYHTHYSHIYPRGLLDESFKMIFF